MRVRTRDKLIKNYIFKYQARYQVQLFETTASSSTLFQTNPRRFEYVFRRRQRVRDREERVIPHHPVTLLLSDSPSPQERRGEEQEEQAADEKREEDEELVRGLDVFHVAR